MQAIIGFADGSSGTVSYLTGGSPRFPKETMDAAAGGRSARLDNFRRAGVWAGKGARTTLRSRGGQDKGQRRQVEACVAACRSGGPMPITLESLVATTAATIAVTESMTSGGPVRV